MIVGFTTDGKLDHILDRPQRHVLAAVKELPEVAVKPRPKGGDVRRRFNEACARRFPDKSVCLFFAFV